MFLKPPKKGAQEMNTNGKKRHKKLELKNNQKRDIKGCPKRREIKIIKRGT